MCLCFVSVHYCVMVYGWCCVLFACSCVFKIVSSVVVYGLMLYDGDCLWVLVFVCVA